MSEATFKANYDVNAAVFTAAVADSLEEVNAEDVEIISVTDSVTARLRRLTTDSVTVDYQVTFNAVALGYADDASGAYDHLVDTLTNAVTSGAFDSNLAANSATYSGSDLASASSSSVESSGYSSADSGDDDGSSSSMLSTTNKLIIGLVVGVGGFFIILFAIVAAMMCCGRSRGVKPSTVTPAN